MIKSEKLSRCLTRIGDEDFYETIDNISSLMLIINMC